MTESNTKTDGCSDWIRSDTIIITTDGSFCDGLSSWAAIFEINGSIKSKSGKGPQLRNSCDAELFAVVMALKEIDEPSTIELWTDSTSILHLSTAIYEKAQRNFMRTKRRYDKPYELLKSFHLLVKKHDVFFRHTPGHRGSTLQMKKAHALALTELRKQTSKPKDELILRSKVRWLPEVDTPTVLDDLPNHDRVKIDTKPKRIKRRRELTGGWLVE